MLALLALMLNFSWASNTVFDTAQSSCYDADSKLPSKVPGSIGVCGDLENRSVSGFNSEQLISDGGNFSHSTWKNVKIGSWSAKFLKMKQTTISNSQFNNLRIADADLVGSQWNRVEWTNFDLQKTNLNGARFQGSKFIGGRWSEVQLLDLYIADSIFEDCILPAKIKIQATLINVKFTRCRFEE